MKKGPWENGILKKQSPTFLYILFVFLFLVFFFHCPQNINHLQGRNRKWLPVGNMFGVSLQRNEEVLEIDSGK